MTLLTASPTTYHRVVGPYDEVPPTDCLAHLSLSSSSFTPPYYLPCHPMTQLSRADEKARLKSMKALIAEKVDRVIAKVGPDKITALAMTRAIGDMPFKPAVTAEPEMMTFKRAEDDQFVIMASDGVWVSLSDSEAVRVVLDNINAGGDVKVKKADLVQV